MFPTCRNMPRTNRELRVMQRRRRDTLLSKIYEFSELFDMDVAVITRDRKTAVSEMFKTAPDPSWPARIDEIVSEPVAPPEAVTT